MAQTIQLPRRIFGGAEPQPTGVFTRELKNPGLQAQAESLAVGTHRRVFRGPRGDSPHWSYHISPVSAAGAASTLNVFYSNLPNPDPATADHWVASGITEIDLTATTDLFATIVDKAPEWIKFEAVVAASAGTIWAYVRSNGIDN